MRNAECGMRNRESSIRPYSAFRIPHSAFVSRRGALILLVLGLAAGWDQGTKEMATRALKFSPRQSFFGDVFRLTYSENPGAFLGLGGHLPPGLRFWLLTVGMGGVLFGLLLFTVFNPRLTTLQVIALALIVGSGLSNWADRVL